MSNVSVESGIQLVARLSSIKRPILENVYTQIFPINRPRQGDIVEICGKSNVGKSFLLMEIMSKTILPIEFGGKNANVIFIQTDNNFQIFKFAAILEKHITESGANADSEVIKKSLENVIFLQCYSLQELELTIVNLHSVFAENTKCGLLAWDSITAFYWLQCSEKRPIRLQTYVKDLVKRIKTVIEVYGVTFIYTKCMQTDDYYQTDTSDLATNFKFDLKNVDDQFQEFNASILQSTGSQISSRKFTIESFGINWLE